MNANDAKIKLHKLIWAEYCKKAFELGDEAIPNLIAMDMPQDPPELMRRVCDVLEMAYATSKFCSPEEREEITKRRLAVNLGTN